MYFEIITKNTREYALVNEVSGEKMALTKSNVISLSEHLKVLLDCEEF